MLAVAQLIQKQSVNGWFIRLVSFRNTYLVNFTAPNGTPYSKRFNSLTQAQAFFAFLCKKLNTSK
jgi:hypothetical protein